MALQVSKISNPLTLIAVFASLAEVVATAVLPTLEGPVQDQFVWFVMLFPVLLVGLFFLTLNFNNKVLYAPGDYEDEANFLRTLVGAVASPRNFSLPVSDGAALRHFWKAGGQVIPANETRLRDWLEQNGQGDTPITTFLFGNEFAKLRKKAVRDLQLS